MHWLQDILTDHTALQALIVISIVCALGLVCGRLKLGGVSLGVTFVFFIGIIAGHFGVSIDPAMLNYARDFGLVLFLYSLGLQVGPGFFSSIRRGGTTLCVLGIALALVGMAVSVAVTYLFPVSLPDAMGLYCGATTNTPALGAVQQTLSQLGIPASTPALGCAATYPLGVVGVIIAIMIMQRFMVRKSDLSTEPVESAPKPYISAFDVCNPGIVDRTIAEVASASHMQFVISRLWRQGKVTIPNGSTRLMRDDRLLVTSLPEDVPTLKILFGQQETRDWNQEDIDWDEVDNRDLISRNVIVTRHELNGRLLGSLKLRTLYGINISRVFRSGVPMLAQPDLRLQLGDRLVIVGEARGVADAEKVLGNAVADLDEPNLVSVFIGIVLGLLLGSIPFTFPGVALPIRLGLAGGPIIMGILVGTFGPRVHMAIYTTPSANRMLRALGLALFLSCLGLDAGASFFETVFRAEGLLWVAAGFVITVLPTLIVGWMSMRMVHLDFGKVSGLLCGSMANPMALDYANSVIPGDRPSVAYATVYPVCMFVRVILAQVLLLIMLG